MWEQVRANRIRSAVVVTVLAVVLGALGAAVGGVFGGGFDRASTLVGVGVALAVWLVLWLIAVSSGDSILLGIAGAREVAHEHHPQLHNVVEEMSIAALLPRSPRVFVVDDPAPNAFATAKDPSRAAVAVTTGLLSTLDRDELQGVVAHEIGHVKNGDTRLMTTAGVMVGAIVLIAEVSWRTLRWGGGLRRSRASKAGGKAQIVVFLVALVFLVLAPILAQVLYFALSRRREYLADASGALFTRYPEGLASALEKIAGARRPLADSSRVTAPMYIVPPMRAHGGGLFRTHPPTESRVRILRSMGKGAGWAAYDAAFRTVKGNGLLRARTLEAAPDVLARAPAPAGPLGSPRERRRQASDAFLAASGYSRVPCPSCGAVLKVPPALADTLVRCPRCAQPLR